MTSVSSRAGTLVATYTYNALGERVVRSGSGVPYGGTLYEIYDPFGRRALIHNGLYTAEDYFPLVGGRDYVKYQNNATYFLHTNTLGSTGTITDATGAWVESEIYDPWGQRWGTYNTPYDEHFAGMMKRDGESGLDHTPNRMFTSSYGRWLSPDPAGTKAVTLTDPQTWNMYAYARNNPTTFTDPSGLCWHWLWGGSCPEDPSPPPAPKLPPPPISNSNRIFSTPNKAGAAAGRADQKASQATRGKPEYANVVFTAPLVKGLYMYTDPVTQGQHGKVDPFNTTGVLHEKSVDLDKAPIPQG